MAVVTLVFLCYEPPEDESLFVETYLGALIYFIHVFYLVHLWVGIKFKFTIFLETASLD
jgi:hypothetical protein